MRSLSRWTPEYMQRKDVLKAIHVNANRAQQWDWPGDAPGWNYNTGPDGAKKDIALLFPKFFAQVSPIHNSLPCSLVLVTRQGHWTLLAYFVCTPAHRIHP